MAWLPDPREEYERRLAAARERVARAERQNLLISNLRLATAAVAAVLAWAIISRRAPGIAILAPAVAFAILVVVHAVRLRYLDRLTRVARFYESGLARLDDAWAGKGRDGARFLTAEHPYARDLDLFGRGSLFELLNVARTEIGEETLAGWLLAPSPIPEVRARQAAVAELGSRLDFREDIAVLAAEAHVASTGELAGWAAAGPAGLGTAAAITFAICSLVTLAAGTAASIGWIESSVLVVWLFVQAGIAAIWRTRVRTVLGRITTPSRDLELLAALLARIEREPFGAERLAAIQATLGRTGMMPSKRIARLERLVSLLDSTVNQIFAPIAAAFMVRSQVAVAIDRWHRASAADVASWLRAVGEVEALASLAGYGYEHPGDPFPELVDDRVVFSGTRIGHPLLPAATAVRNDVSIGGGGARVLIVSGSNMSGKSTLLRAVGANVVLALAGAPARASSLVVSPLAVGATLRVEDSLQEGRSRFYAEILRLRAIIDLTRGTTPVLFLLDEILHGTNSFDRRIGAEAVVRSLIDRGAIGLVTTHDLALTQFAETLGGRGSNVHFEDRLENGAMVFDYKMRPGVVEHSNALALMRAVGLDV